MTGISRSTATVMIIMASLAAAACSTAARPRLGDSAAPVLTSRGTELGMASWYGPGFHGKLTASGTIYDQNAMTAAHRTLPLGTIVRVTSISDRRSVLVRITDRGPYKSGRIIDLSRAAATALGIVEKGTAGVEISIPNDSEGGWPTTYYSVQIGAFSRRQQADRTGRAVALHGARAYLQASAPGQIRHYRVRVGPFRDRREAVAAAARLAREGFDPLVVEESSAVARYFERRSAGRDGNP